jgi:trk system potassium uptake protein TrkA
VFVLIVGGGKTGAHLAGLLLAGGNKAVIVDPRPEITEPLRQRFPRDMVLTGDGADPKVLIQAGIKKADVVAAVASDDEDNLVVSTISRFEFAVPRVIARVNDPDNAWLFTRDMGVDVALNQADLMAKLIAEEMSIGDMVTLLKLRRGQYSLIEVKVAPGSIADGKAVRDLDLPCDCVLSAILRKGDLILPRADTVLQPIDEVLAIVRPDQQADLERLVARPDA